MSRAEQLLERLDDFLNEGKRNALGRKERWSTAKKKQAKGVGSKSDFSAQEKTAGMKLKSSGAKEGTQPDLVPDRYKGFKGHA